MDKLSTKLRIGEKIGISFGVVGLLFLGVIWQYHTTLHESLADYERLQNVFAAKKSYAVEIEKGMLEAERAEKAFLIHRDEKYATEVTDRITEVLAHADKLGTMDAAASEASRQIVTLVKTYHARFKDIAQAWRKKGLDHNGGLQGAFRDTVHRLEDLAGTLKVSNLYLQLLQIRRGEKDLGLRRDPVYRQKVFGLVEGFKQKTRDSELLPEVKAQLLEEIETYRVTFEEYSEVVLADQDIKGGKGPFRQAAHRIEDILKAHFVWDMEANVMQLRRREKDYLLRLDQRYVDMALKETDKIHSQVNESSISDQDKALLLGLLSDYKRDFLALVAQNSRIDELSREMEDAFLQIEPLVKANVAAANRSLAEMTERIRSSSQSSARIMLWIVLIATILGIVLAVLITRRITQPLLHMAGLLDRLAAEEPTDRIPTSPGARDEINAMAESVNAMADHKARLIAWWKASMHEQAASKDMREAAADSGARREARTEFDQALEAKTELLQDALIEIRGRTLEIMGKTERLLTEPVPGQDLEETKAIEKAAKTILGDIDVIISAGASAKTENNPV